MPKGGKVNRAIFEADTINNALAVLVSASKDRAYNPSWSPDDQLIYYMVPESGLRVSHWRDRRVSPVGPPGFGLPEVSPDGKKLACYGLDSAGVLSLGSASG